MPAHHRTLGLPLHALLMALAAAAAPPAAGAQTLQGLVRDRATQQPVAGAEVTLVDAHGEAAGTAQSGADGSFYVTGTAAGEYRLAARKPGYQVMLSNAVQLAQGQVMQVEARLTPQQAEVAVASAAALPADRGITGRVTESSTGRPISDVAVALLNGHGQYVTRVTTDAQGSFRLTVPTPDRYQLRAERVGYQPSTSQSITVVPSDTVRVGLVMSTDAVMLAPLTVVASSRSVARNTRMAAFEWRAEHNPWGRFVGPEQIQRIRPMFATDVLQHVAGVQVEGSGLNRVPTVRGRLGSRCVPSFYVDGHRSTGISLDELVNGPDVAAVEVYDQPYEAPVEFLPPVSHQVCGVIVIWTKQAIQHGG